MSKKLIFSVSRDEKQEDFSLYEEMSSQEISAKVISANKETPLVQEMSSQEISANKNPAPETPVQGMLARKMSSQEISETNFTSEKESLGDFLNSVSQLKTEVEHLSFMISEIRQVLETSSSIKKHQPA